MKKKTTFSGNARSLYFALEKSCKATGGQRIARFFVHHGTTCIHGCTAVVLLRCWFKIDCSRQCNKNSNVNVE